VHKNRLAFNFLLHMELSLTRVIYDAEPMPFSTLFTFAKPKNSDVVMSHVEKLNNFLFFNLKQTAFFI